MATPPNTHVEKRGSKTTIRYTRVYIHPDKKYACIFCMCTCLLIAHLVWSVLGALRSQKNMFYIFALSSAHLGIAKAMLFQDHRASFQKWPHKEVYSAPSIYPLHIFSVITVPVSAVLEFFITTIFLGENKKRPSLRVFSWFLICSKFSNYAHVCLCV